MSFVKIPPSYFKKAKLEYADWRFAWFREVIQNAVDAGCQDIFFTSAILPSGQLQITCLDNGRGMTEHVMINVLLALGESEKVDGSVGGFGMAKNIILLAHDTWEVHSGNTLCVGKGGDYEVIGYPECGDYVMGTRVGVTFDREDSDEARMKASLDKLMGALDCPVRIYWNRTPMLRSKASYAFDYEKEVPELGVLKFSDDPNPTGRHSLWVRVDGLPMFEYTIWAHSAKAFRAVLDLKDSRGILTVNRDGLREQPQRVLNELVHKLSEDLRSLKQGILQFQVIVNPSDGIVQYVPGEVDEVFEDERDGTLTKLQKLRYRLRKRLFDPAYPSDFFVRVHSIALKRTQNSESISVREVRKLLRTTMNKKLALTWMTACKAVLTLPRFGYGSVVPKDGSNELGFDIQAPFYLGERRVYFGFIFDPQTEACCVTNSKAITLFLNPTVFDSNLAWRGKDNLANLMDLAFHELAHVHEPNHSADFCNEECELRRQYRRVFEDRMVYQTAHKVFQTLRFDDRSEIEELDT